MTTLPLISIIIPVYNVERYLSECVDSVLNQTYQNIEIILINDGSTDTSTNIANEYAQNYNNIFVYHQQNQGLSAARNKGLSLARGEFISFVDSDDMISPCFIDTLYSICRDYDCDIAMCNVLESTSCPDSFSLSLPSLSSPRLLTGRFACLELYSGSLEYGVMACNKLYRKVLFQDVEFPVGKIHEDNGTTYKLYYKSNRVGIIDDRLYYYRIVPTSITRARYNLRRLDVLELTLQSMEYFRQNNEAIIYSYSRREYLSLLIHSKYDVHKHILESHDIEDKLEFEIGKYFQRVILDKNIPYIMRIHIYLLRYCPAITRNIVWIYSKFKFV